MTYGPCSVFGLLVQSSRPSPSTTSHWSSRRCGSAGSSAFVTIRCTDDEETERAVDPYHITYYAGGLYRVGYCHLRKAVRIFAVERIRGMRLLKERYEIPADFDAVAYLNNAWGIVRGDLVKI